MSIMFIRLEEQKLQYVPRVEDGQGYDGQVRKDYCWIYRHLYMACQNVESKSLTRFGQCAQKQNQRLEYPSRVLLHFILSVILRVWMAELYMPTL